MENRLIPITAIVEVTCIFVNLYLWISFLSIPFGPTEKEAYFRITVAILVPLILSVSAFFLKKPWLMYAAFVCAVPIGLYLLGQNGIWQLFGSLQLLYLLAAVLMTCDRAKTERIR
jgi:hypothetical protein